MPSHNLDFDERDLSEAPRLAKDTQPRGLIVGGCVAVVLFLALLAYGSLPELSPEEIVAMEGYAGEQPTKHIFNIHSLEQAVAEKQVAAKPAVETTAKMDQPKPEILEIAEKEMAEPATRVETASPVVVTTAIQPEVVEPLKPSPEPVDVAVLQPQPVAEQAPREEVVIVEQISEPVVETVASRTASPAVLFSTEERVVAAEATTPTIDEASDTVVVSSVAAIEPVPLPVGSSAIASDSRGKLLPLRSVLADFTELKASPTTRSRTLLSLGRGVVVTAFERHGKWIHIGTNDGSSITGYVLETSLGRVGAKNSG